MGTKSKSLVMVLVALFLTSLVVFPPATVKAQSKTIVVPDDYPTLGLAIGNATDGDTIFVRNGTYHESAIKTDKSLSIIGKGFQSTKINFTSPSHEVIVRYLNNYHFL